MHRQASDPWRRALNTRVREAWHRLGRAEEADERSRLRRGLTLFGEIGSAVAFIVLLVGAGLSKDVRDWIRTAAEDVGDWLYPDRLIVALAVITVSLLTALLLVLRPKKQPVVVQAPPPAPGSTER